MDKKQYDEAIKYLWESFLSGDDRSFSAIYEFNINPLLSYGYKLCADREIVRDCIQEIFIDLFLKRKNIKIDIRNLKAYLYIALRNNILKKIKQTKRIELVAIKENHQELDFNVEYSCQDQMINEEISNERKQILDEATKKLPSKQKEIIFLRFEEELNYNEIAEIMNISVESARKLMYRALTTLKKKIDKENFSPLFFAFFSKFLSK